MPVVVIANPKGGVGKSTMATKRGGLLCQPRTRHHAGRCGPAAVHPPVAEPAASHRRGPLPPGTWGWTHGQTAQGHDPCGAGHPGGGSMGPCQRGDEVRRQGDRAAAAQRVSTSLPPALSWTNSPRHSHAGKVQVGIVGMRVDARTIAADKLHEFVDALGLPVLGYVRHTQNYIHLAARGLTLFDVAPGRVEKDLEQWQGICRWLDK